MHELPHAPGYVVTGWREVNGEWIETGHVAGIEEVDSLRNGEYQDEAH